MHRAGDQHPEHASRRAGRGRRPAAGRGRSGWWAYRRIGGILRSGAGTGAPASCGTHGRGDGSARRAPVGGARPDWHRVPVTAGGTAVPRLRPRRAPTGPPTTRWSPRHPGDPPPGPGVATMRVGVAREVKNREYRVALTPAGVTELVARRARRCSWSTARARARRSRTPTSPPPGRRIVPTADDVWADADLLLKVKEPVAEEYAPPARRPDAVHLPAPGRVPGVHRRAARRGHHRHRLRDGADRRRRAAAARPDVRGRRADGPAGRRAHPRAGAGRPRRAARRGVRRARGEGRRHRRRGVRDERRRRSRWACRREVTVLDRDIDKLRAADRIYQGHLQTVASNAYEVERAVLDADLVIGAVLVPGAKAPDAGQQRAGVADEAGLGARRHRRRPGRLLRGHPAHHPRRPDLPACTTRSSTAWRTCPARCRTPRPTRSPT